MFAAEFGVADEAAPFSRLRFEVCSCFAGVCFSLVEVTMLKHDGADVDK